MRFPLDNYTVTQGYTPPTHEGIDLAAPEGTPILSPVTGQVIQVGTNPSYIGGNYVIVREDDPEHLEYYMGHQSLVETTTGTHVQEGQEIGKVGHTGLATGPHVHFQIRSVNSGALHDPNEVLSRKGGDMPDLATEEDVNELTVGMSNLEISANPNFKNNVGRPLRDVIKEVRMYPTSVDFRLDAQAYREGQTATPKVVVNGKEYVPKV